jgi:hypothetical protein
MHWIGYTRTDRRGDGCVEADSWLRCCSPRSRGWAKGGRLVRGEPGWERTKPRDGGEIQRFFEGNLRAGRSRMKSLLSPV